MIVTVLMSDIRSYSTIAEHADPSQLAGQLNTHRAAMNRAILGEGGTVMQFVGDAVMAVFGAPFPQPDHADRAVAAAAAMHALQAEINAALGGRRAAPRSAWASACPPARRRRRCSARRSGWSTRWSATRSTCPSGCSSSPRPARPCCPRPPARALTVPASAVALPAQLVKGRDTPDHRLQARAEPAPPSPPPGPTNP